MEIIACSVDGCERKAASRSWCTLHYKRWARLGSPTAGRSKTFDPEQTFSERTEWQGECLVWTGSLWDGYGHMTAGGTKYLVHRYAWARANGPIPEGMQIDHRCHNRACCNAEHLRLATPGQNRQNLRSDGGHLGISGVRGVSWIEARQHWRAQVKYKGKFIQAGTFDSIEEAGAAAKAKRNELFSHNDLDRTN